MLRSRLPHRRFGRLAIPVAIILAIIALTTTGKPAPQPDPSITVLYPASAALPAAGFLQTYLAVQTASHATCRYSLKDVSYDSMTPFTNTGTSTFHSNLVYPAAASTSTTYYVRCSDDNGNVTSSTPVTVSIGPPTTTIPSNLRPVAVSPTHVLIEWSDPDPNSTKHFNIYRDGVGIGTANTTAYLDATASPATLYRYAVSDTFASGEGPRSPEAPAVTPPVPALPPSGTNDHVVLDGFEQGQVRVVNSNEPNPVNRYLWSQYPFTELSQSAIGIGVAEVTADQAHGGRFSLRDTLSGAVPPPYQKPSSAYLQFYPYSEKANGWFFMNHFLAEGSWQPDTYNRLRFWVKVPREFAATRAPADQDNVQVGTYVRSTHGSPLSGAGAESGLGGAHYYHLYNIPFTGEWHQVIIDSHPHHQRGGAGFFEWGDIPYPTGEPGHNYFDSLTRFYVDFTARGSLTSYPSSFYFDDFELYAERRAENIDQVFALNGVFVPASNQLFVGWSHPKNDGVTKHEVRYSFGDILDQGWDAATPAPGGLISPLGDVYSGMIYETSQIPVTGHQVLYIAIKPQNSKLFRQIAVPVSHIAQDPGRPGKKPAR